MNGKKILHKTLSAALLMGFGASIPLLMSHQQLSDKELPQSQVAALAVLPEVPAGVKFADEFTIETFSEPSPSRERPATPASVIRLPVLRSAKAE